VSQPDPHPDAPASHGSLAPSLLLRLRGHDNEAWRRLAALYGPILDGWCRCAGLSEQDADDVKQEVFRSVAQHLGAFRRERPRDSFRGWLWRITHNKLRDFWRRQRHRPQAVGGTAAQQRFQELAQESEDSLPPDSPAESGALYRRALDLLRAEFEARTWQAFWGVAVEGRAAADVAAELAMSPGAVYVAKSRVLRRLREDLGELLD
jgi:RNA polymerase sigma-70 factor (ECF subfamily)